VVYDIRKRKVLRSSKSTSLYGTVSKAWKSQGSRPALSFRDVQAKGEEGDVFVGREGDEVPVGNGK
jgi:hypothetical protein